MTSIKDAQTWMSCLPHTIEATSKVASLFFKTKMSWKCGPMDIQLVFITLMSMLGVWKMQHLVVVLMTIPISVDIEISWYHCITPNQTSDHEDCLLYKTGRGTPQRTTAILDYSLEYNVFLQHWIKVRWWISNLNIISSHYSLSSI